MYLYCIEVPLKGQPQTPTCIGAEAKKVSQTLNTVFLGHYQGNLWLTFPLMKPNVVPDGYCKVLKPPASKFFLTSTGL